VILSHIDKRTFQRFAKKVGLVYFGYVDQRNDEHSLIRGMTVSTKHRDNHYCIGSFEGYDVTLVKRIDTIHFPGKPSRLHSWVIMTFDLHRFVDLPHVFLGSHSHNETFYAQFFTKYSHFSKIDLEQAGTYPAHFIKRHTLFAKADQSLSAERLFNPTLAQSIDEQFGVLSIEIHDGTVYLYAEHQHPSMALLDSMLTRGLWLARTIDNQEE
ncbi:MAG TPA: hypothetical protein VGO98_00935, partial [Candidatus Saccharimonadales bacterium]|nr:hypothetical protein [Candidatus Saccharimonadales bacterium]